ncbi:MAG TPA: polymer-forming cytoskeletal protein [Tepidisphaeraceae bacterium]|nr:polymer-forming cytoskeletal protein [Tepidisphaeraceae bacterium]
MSRFTGFANPAADDRQTVICLYCGKPNEVGRRAMTVSCKFCYKALNLQDVQFKQYEARRAVETCGVVTVEKKGNVVADRVNVGGLIVRGKLRGDVTSRGPVLVGPDAELKGNITAPTLAVGAGAILEGQYKIGEMAPAPDVTGAPPTG